MVKQYRKKPVVIEAVQFTGENHKEITGFCDNWHGRWIGEPGLGAKMELSIVTLEGEMHLSPGDYVIKWLTWERNYKGSRIYQTVVVEKSDALANAITAAEATIKKTGGK